MWNHPCGWLAGFVNADLRKMDDARRLSLNMFLSFPKASVRVRLLDRNEQEIVGIDACPVTLFEEEVLLNGPERIPFSRANQRLLQLFGRRRPFFSGNVVVDVPVEHWRQCRYAAVYVTPMEVAPIDVGPELPMSCPSECVYLEMSRKRLAAFGPQKLFLMISKGAARSRMEKLLRTYPELRKQHDNVRRALSSLMTKLFRGGDNELLTEDL